MMSILRVLAETQRLMANSMNGNTNNRSRVLSTVKLPEFNGDIRTTVRQYRQWRRQVDVVQQLNDIKPKELISQWMYIASVQSLNKVIKTTTI